MAVFPSSFFAGGVGRDKGVGNGLYCYCDLFTPDKRRAGEGRCLWRPTGPWSGAWVNMITYGPGPAGDRVHSVPLQGKFATIHDVSRCLATTGLSAPRSRGIMTRLERGGFLMGGQRWDGDWIVLFLVGVHPSPHNGLRLLDI